MTRRGRSARTVLPPLLACGLALLLVRPTSALEPAASSPAATDTPAYAAGALPGAKPAVSFTERVPVVDGRIRTAVLVDPAAPPGTASVVGAVGCAVPARAGVTAWLDCPYAAQRTVTIAVTLSDGRRFTHTVVPTIG